MKKYRCPKCKTTFIGKLEICPNCSTRLHYLDEEVKKEVGKVQQPQFHFEDDNVLNKGVVEDPDPEVEYQREMRKQQEEQLPADVKRDADGNPLSYFDGNTFQKFLWTLLAVLLTLTTAFIALPWAMCMKYRWETKHTVIDGRRMYFDGKGIQLFGRYLLWLLLTIVTLTIFLVFLINRVKKWKILHTHFVKSANM